jgi:AraC family transcriptional regulator, regulatory protein of adaptative response / methylated-DNA-[protein]-cysteine methyltransferase
MTHRTEQPMARARLAHDAACDGLYAATAGSHATFCRPACAALPLRRGKVRLFATAREALFCGYRPCERCRPLEAGAKLPRWAAGLLARLTRAPTMRIGAAQLRRVGIDPARARRYFQRRYGLTFQAFARASRLREVFRRVREAQVMQRQAFESDEAAGGGGCTALAQLTPHAGDAAVAGEPVTLAWIETPLGPMLAGARRAALCLLEFTDRRMLETQLRILAQRLRAPLVPGRNALTDRLRAELAGYFAGTRRAFTVPLEHPGTAFQQRVWQALIDIPYGQTCSYRDLARRLGKPGAVRAVGRANGMNRIAIVIPCHRVIYADGKLGGYGGGLSRKQQLLDLERGDRLL